MLPPALKFTALQGTSLITGLMAVVLGVVYFGPPELVRRSLPPKQTSLVQAVENLGPVWPLLFTVMGVALIAAVTGRRYIVGAHVFAIFGWMFYGACIVIGAAASVPPAPIVTGLIAIGVAGIHGGLMLAHQDAGDQ